MKNTIKKIGAAFAAVLTTATISAGAGAISYWQDPDYYEYDPGYYDYYDYYYYDSDYYDGIYGGDTFIGKDSRYGNVYYGSDIGYYYYGTNGKVKKLGWTFTLKTGSSKTGTSKKQTSTTVYYKKPGSSTNRSTNVVVSSSTYNNNKAKNNSYYGVGKVNVNSSSKTGASDNIVVSSSSTKKSSKKKSSAKTISGYTYNGCYSYGGLTEYYYSNRSGSSITVRKASGSYDVSGDTSYYDAVTYYKLNNVYVTIKGYYFGRTPQYNLAIWSKGGYSYAVICSDPISASQIKAIVRAYA